MAVFKCKMCGGSLEVSEGMTVCECEYCGTQQTLPKNHDEVLTNLFNRANNLRTKSEFDKAQDLYEKIVGQNPTEAEAYWGIILCKFGIEYVEDPATLKKIPTCHRTQLESVKTDADYQMALEYADAVQRTVYEREADEIDRLQKDILTIVHKEKPFDVFICYKETDENGRRTQDSVIANDIYHQLTQEGFKVFYAAITLEDKLGQAYEPYIFAALNSAKVMLVLGTKPEYFNAVWVRNEWSRYLKIVQNDRSKLLIPCYRDMDAYDLPDEFSHLQAQDMSKIGFINDVIRGIRKVLIKDTPTPAAVKETVVQSKSGSNIENTLKRGKLALEDGKWDDANRFFEQVLDENVEEPRAYIGLLCAEMRVQGEENLAQAKHDFSSSDHFRKACRFGGESVKNRLLEYSRQAVYANASALLASATSTFQCNDAMQQFQKLGEYADAPQKAEESRLKACRIRYNQANSILVQADTDEQLDKAQKEFAALGNFEDAAQKVEECMEKKMQLRYDAAVDAMNHADYKTAVNIFGELGDYKDSAETRQELIRKDSIYQQGMELLKCESLDERQKGMLMLQQISDYLDAGAMISRVQSRITKEIRRRDYEAQSSRIVEAKRALYDESAHLGFFAKQRKNEIANLLRELSDQEARLNSEYSDILK